MYSAVTALLLDPHIVYVNVATQSELSEQHPGLSSMHFVHHSAVLKTVEHKEN